MRRLRVGRGIEIRLFGEQKDVELAGIWDVHMTALMDRLGVFTISGLRWDMDVGIDYDIF